jgi:hypothetical protein
LARNNPEVRRVRTVRPVTEVTGIAEHLLVGRPSALWLSKEFAVLLRVNHEGRPASGLRNSAHGMADMDSDNSVSLSAMGPRLG